MTLSWKIYKGQTTPALATMESFTPISATNDFRFGNWKARSNGARLFWTNEENEQEAPVVAL